MEYKVWMDIAETAALLILGSGGGVLYANAKKKKHDAEAKKETLDADLAEANAYKTRIVSLGQEVETLTKALEETKIKMREANELIDELQNKLKKCEDERDLYHKLSERQTRNIDELNEHIVLLEKQNAALAKRNSRLKIKIQKLNEE